MNGYRHWVTPWLEEPPYVPDANAVAGVVADLLEAGWIQRRPAAPHDEATPFYYSSFPRVAHESSVRSGDPRFDLAKTSDLVIRAFHCRSITVMVTDHLLVAPTTEALQSHVTCAECGEALLADGEPEMSRIVPDSCASCAAAVVRSRFRDLSCFRFALVIEPWYPPARADVAVDPALLGLLARRSGHSFKEAGDHGS
jgi:hypothetical protein